MTTRQYFSFENQILHSGDSQPQGCLIYQRISGTVAGRDNTSRWQNIKHNLQSGLTLQKPKQINDHYDEGACPYEHGPIKDIKMKRMCIIL